MRVVVPFIPWYGYTSRVSATYEFEFATHEPPRFVHQITAIRILHRSSYSVLPGVFSG